MATIKFEFSIDTENGEFSIVNIETGEVKEVAIPKAKKATSSKKTTSKKDDGDPTPKIILEDNKYTLNQAAANLLVDESLDENRLEIKYEKDGRVTRPIIGNNVAFGTKGGNKVNKSNGVSCRGKAHDELIKYGTIFTLEEHPTKEGLYYLNGNIEREENELDGDENISIPDEDTPVIVNDDDLDLDGLMSDDDNETTADEFDFTL